MAFYDLLWQNTGLIGLVLSFLAVIDPNSFGLVLPCLLILKDYYPIIFRLQNEDQSKRCRFYWAEESRRAGFFGSCLRNFDINGYHLDGRVQIAKVQKSVKDVTKQLSETTEQEMNWFLKTKVALMVTYIMFTISLGRIFDLKIFPVRWRLHLFGTNYPVFMIPGIVLPKGVKRNLI